MPVQNALETFAFGNNAPVLFLCDHASNAVPETVAGGCLGLPEVDMQRHIAFDIGARGVTIALAEAFGSSAVLSRFSRLVIDPNRAEDDPTLIMQLYDGTVIPGNRRIDAKERQARLDTLYRPYHQAVSDEIARLGAQHGAPPLIVSMHSFTPQLRGKPPRPWHVGVLSATDRRLADPLLGHLADEPDLVVGDNVPYHGHLVGDCMDRHGLQNNIAHVLVELRNDLISDESAEQEWARRLVPGLRRMCDDYWEKESRHGYANPDRA